MVDGAQCIHVQYVLMKCHCTKDDGCHTSLQMHPATVCLNPCPVLIVHFASSFARVCSLDLKGGTKLDLPLWMARSIKVRTRAYVCVSVGVDVYVELRGCVGLICRFNQAHILLLNIATATRRGYRTDGIHTAIPRGMSQCCRLLPHSPLQSAPPYVNTP